MGKQSLQSILKTIERPEGKIGLAFDGLLPLNDLFKIIELHYNLKKKKKELDGVLEQRATQLRAIEKRMLIRFKVSFS